MMLAERGDETATARSPATSERRIRIVRSLADIEDARSAWEAAPIARFDADIDFYLAFAASRSSFVRPHVVVVERGGALEGLFVGRVEDVVLPAAIGYRQVLRSRVRALTLVHGGLVGMTEGVAPLVLRELRNSLARGEADVLSLPALTMGTPLQRAVAREVPAVLRAPAGHASVHRRLVLPDTFDEFLRSRSKSTRESLKRYRKKVDRELGERLELELLDAPADLERIFAATEPVAARTYQRGLGVALADSPEQRALLEIGLQRGWFRAYVLRLDGTTIAFWPGSAYRGTFFIGTPGYDPAFAEYRIGTYLLVRILEQLVADPAVHVVDYGFGDAEYKRRCGSESREERAALVFAPSPRPLAINAARAGITLAATGAASVLERAGALEVVKRRWRRRLATADGGEHA